MGADELMAIGFTKNAATKALNKFDGDFEQALNSLLIGDPETLSGQDKIDASMGGDEGKTTMKK